MHQESTHARTGRRAGSRHSPLRSSRNAMQCPFCDSLNPKGARFCSACGAQLDLVPCPRCGAVNDVAASHCHQCNDGLGLAEGDAGRAPASARSSIDRRVEALQLIEAAPAPEEPAIGRSRVALGSLRLAVVVLVLAAVAAGLYMLLLDRPGTETPPDLEQGAASTGTRPIRPARTSNGPVAAVPAPAGPPASQGANGAARAPIATTCTRGVAALGLCDPEPTPAGTSDAGTPRGRDAPRPAAGTN